MTLKTKFLIEVAAKSSLVVLLFLFVIAPWAKDGLLSMEGENQSSVLSMMGFLMAGAIVGAFELSYSRTNLESNLQRYLAHVTKFFLYLGISMLMLVAMSAMGTTPGFFNDIILFSAFFIYVSLFLHDFWEALCATERLTNQ